MSASTVAQSHDSGHFNGLPRRSRDAGGPQTSVAGSAVSWPSIFAGAAAAAALSLMLMVLGVGLGLSAVSPWAQAGVAATTFGVSTIVWITFTQLVASGMGGYLAGLGDRIVGDGGFADIHHRVHHLRWRAGGCVGGWWDGHGHLGCSKDGRCVTRGSG
jgi:hypothetical protein